MEATGRNPFSPLSCTQTCMLGLALSQAGTEFVLAQDYGLIELAHPPSWSHAESAGGSSQLDVHNQWFWAKQLLCNFTSAFFILRYKHNGVWCAEKHGLNIIRVVRNPAENILKVHMDGGNTWLQEKTEALCVVPHLRSNPTTLDIWLLRGLCGSAHAALSGLFQGTSGTSATSWLDTAQSPPGDAQVPRTHSCPEANWAWNPCMFSVLSLVSVGEMRPVSNPNSYRLLQS